MAQRRLQQALAAAALVAAVAAAAPASAVGREGEHERQRVSDASARSLPEQIWRWMASALGAVFPGGGPHFPDAAPDDLPDNCPACGDKGGGIDPNG